MTKRTCGPRFQSTLHALLLCLIHALQPLEEAHQKDALENQLYHVNCLVSRGLAYYTQQHLRFLLCFNSQMCIRVVNSNTF